MLRFRLFAVIAALAMTGCAAQDEWRPPAAPVPLPVGMIDASDVAEITGIARRYGSADWERDGFRDPLILADAAGVPYRIEFYGCAAGRDCTDLRFVAKFPVRGDGAGADPAAWHGGWNRTRRFGKASIDTDGTTILEMNVALSGGVSRQNLGATFDWWAFALKDFARGAASRGLEPARPGA